MKIIVALLTLQIVFLVNLSHGKSINITLDEVLAKPPVAFEPKKKALTSYAKELFKLAEKEFSGGREMKKVIDLLTRSSDAGNPIAAFYLATFLSTRGDFYNTNDVKRAVKLFHRAANDGVNMANLYLACAYLNGRGVEKDLNKVKLFIYYQSEFGDFPDSRFSKDPNNSVLCSPKLNPIPDIRANVGKKDAVSQSIIGTQYLLESYSEISVAAKKKKLNESIDWLKQAANNDDPSAQYLLALIYSPDFKEAVPFGPETDVKKAKYWNEKAYKNKNKVRLKSFHDRVIERKQLLEKLLKNPR